MQISDHECDDQREHTSTTASMSKQDYSVSKRNYKVFHHQAKKSLTNRVQRKWHGIMMSKGLTGVHRRRNEFNRFKEQAGAYNTLSIGITVSLMTEVVRMT